MLQATKCFFFSITHIHSLMEIFLGNVGFSVFPKATWTRCPVKLGVKPFDWQTTALPAELQLPL